MNTDEVVNGVSLPSYRGDNGKQATCVPMNFSRVLECNTAQLETLFDYDWSTRVIAAHGLLVHR